MSTYMDNNLYPLHTNMNQGIEILSRTNSNWLFESKETTWSLEENKQFEDALALFDKDTPDRWYNIAAMVPGKTVNDVIKQYKALEEDVSVIEAGLFPVPDYATDHCFGLEWIKNQGGFDGMEQIYVPGGKRSLSGQPCDQAEKKKGVPWTEEEHRQFLLGLKKYGKGDWRNISRNFVTSRTPTQVASHAQKYFIRQLSGGKDKRRSSIHDITTASLVNTKSTSPEDIKPQAPNIIGMEEVLHNWNLQNQGAIMAFDMPFRTKIETFNENSACEQQLHEQILQNPQFGFNNSISWTQPRQQR